MSSSSLAWRIASRASWRLVGGRGVFFLERSFEDMEHREVLRAVCCPLAFDDISQGSDHDRSAVDIHPGGLTAQSIEGSDAVDLTGEVDLELIVWAENAVDRGDGGEWLREMTAEGVGDFSQFRFVGGGGAIQEVEVESCDWRALEGGAGVTNEDRLQLGVGKGVGNLDQAWRGVHDSNVSRSDEGSQCVASGDGGMGLRKRTGTSIG